MPNLRINKKILLSIKSALKIKELQSLRKNKKIKLVYLSFFS